jgi:hypothetical protein
MLRRSKTVRPRLTARSSKKPRSAALAGTSLAEVLEPLLWLLETVGITRREVLATIRGLPVVKLPAPVTVVRGRLEYWSRTMIRWSADPQFLGQDGRPRDMFFEAGHPSFSDLVGVELPGESAAMCRDILLATDAIVRLPHGQLRWRERAALAAGVETGIVLADEYLRPLRALLLALQTNLLRRARGDPAVAFQRAVSGFEISPEDMVELQGFVSRHGTILLETVDDWLVDRQRTHPRSERRRSGLVRPYLGLYLSTDASDSALPYGELKSGRRKTLVTPNRRKQSG